MADPSLQQLGRRERQIMEAVYRRGSATVAEVRGDLPDGPSYSTVRTMLRLLEDKGHLRHRADGRRFVYAPVVTPTKARRTAVRNLLATFFGGVGRAGRRLAAGGRAEPAHRRRPGPAGGTRGTGSKGRALTWTPPSRSTGRSIGPPSNWPTARPRGAPS